MAVKFAEKTSYRCYKCKRAGRIIWLCDHCGGSGRVEVAPLTPHRLREHLHYDPKTGIWTWVNPTARRVRVGDGAGWLSHKGDKYLTVNMGGIRYPAHRLAWFWMTSEWPEEMVDHINLNGLDNRWENLRLATNAENMRNSGRRSTNTTGRKGVHFCHMTGRYRAQIWVNYKRIELGRFDTVEEAGAAYEAAAHKHHGEFARTE